MTRLFISPTSLNGGLLIIGQQGRRPMVFSTSLDPIDPPNTLHDLYLKKIILMTWWFHEKIQFKKPDESCHICFPHAVNNGGIEAATTKRGSKRLSASFPSAFLRCLGLVTLGASKLETSSFPVSNDPNWVSTKIEPPDCWGPKPYIDTSGLLVTWFLSMWIR